MTFWRLRVGMETVLEFLKSPMRLNDFVSAEIKGQSAASLLLGRLSILNLCDFLPRPGGDVILSSSNIPHSAALFTHHDGNV